MSSFPDLDRQRRFAAQRSAESRRRQKAIRLLLRDGKIDVDAMLRGELPDTDVNRQVEDVISRWDLERLLRRLPGIGPTRAFQVLQAMRATPTMKVSSLSTARRGQLAEMVAEATNRAK